jgi:tetratricopeptide (TPR) repeat protein
LVQKDRSKAKQAGDRENLVKSIEKGADRADPQAMLAEGIQLHQAGRLAEARARYERVLAHEPNNPAALAVLGTICVDTGEVENGIAMMERATEINPTIVGAHFNLGCAFERLGRYDDALARFDRAIAQMPNFAQFHNQRGLLLGRMSRQAEAFASHSAAIWLDAGFLDARFQCARMLHEADRLEEAIAGYDAVLSLQRNYPAALSNRGLALIGLGRLQEGLANIDEAIGLGESASANRETFAMLWRNRGMVLTQMNRFEEALASIDQALSLNNGFSEFHRERGRALTELGRFEEADESFGMAIAIRPDNVHAHFGRALLFDRMRRRRDAIANYEAGLRLAPEDANGQLSRALCLLSLGELSEGFKEFRWRWKTDLYKGSMPERPDPPLWTGENLAGKSIMVLREQGFGDNIQFVRYALMMAKVAKRVCVVTRPELQRLFGRISGIDVVSNHDGSGFDYQIALMDLPHIFGTTIDTIPADAPYLSAASDDVDSWSRRLAPYNGRLKVGLVWAGSAHEDQAVEYTTDQRRSIPFSTLAALGGIDGARYFSLQLGKPAEQARQLPSDLELVDLTKDIRDFADTAAIVANLDLVITVDTSVAHLAGALGKPVWILSRFDGCWRWLNGREDSPWYPTARLFHQTSPGDWDEVVERVCARLRSFRSEPGACA